MPGPEQLLAGRPMLVVTAIATQIAATLTLVGVFSMRPGRDEPTESGSGQKDELQDRVGSHIARSRLTVYLVSVTLNKRDLVLPGQFNQSQCMAPPHGC